MNLVKRRAAASLLSLAFVLSFLPTAALATELEEAQIVTETAVEGPVAETAVDGVFTDEQADEPFTPPDEPDWAVDTEDPAADKSASPLEDGVDSDGAYLEEPAQDPPGDEEAAQEAPNDDAETAETEGAPDEVESGTTIESGLRELTSGTYVLTCDVDLSANSGLTTYSVGEEYDFVIPEGMVVELDLNGYALTGSGDGPVIYVLGTLYLSDSSGGAGVVTGGYQSSDTSVNSAVGGGVYVANDGTFVMTGGVITGNTAYSGGGVYVDGGTFRFEGGEISGNKAVGNPSDKYGVGETVPGAGGGVYVANGVFEMTDGQISDNQATRTGGGIYLGGNSGASVSGGSVTGNVITYQYSLGGGIAYVGGTLTLSGNPYIYGNSSSYNGSSNACNLLIGESNWNSASLLVLSGNLDAEAVIGLSLLANQKPEEGQTVPVTASEAGSSWYKTAYLQFVPDDSSLRAAYDDEGRQVVIGYGLDFDEKEDHEPDEEIYNVYFVIPNGVGGSFAPHNEGDSARYTTTAVAAEIPFGGVTYRVEFPQIAVSEGCQLTGWNIVGAVTETWAPETWMIEDVQNYAKGYDLVVEAVIEAVEETPGDSPSTKPGDTIMNIRFILETTGEFIAGGDYFLPAGVQNYSILESFVPTGYVMTVSGDFFVKAGTSLDVPVKEIGEDTPPAETGDVIMNIRFVLEKTGEFIAGGDYFLPAGVQNYSILEGLVPTGYVMSVSGDFFVKAGTSLDVPVKAVADIPEAANRVITVSILDKDNGVLFPETYKLAVDEDAYNVNTSQIPVEWIPEGYVLADVGDLWIADEAITVTVRAASVSSEPDTSEEESSPESENEEESAEGGNDSGEDVDSGSNSDSSSNGGSGSNGSRFEDVTSDDYYSDAVDWAVANGITEGINETIFGANVPSTRAEMVTFIWRSMGSPDAGISEVPFVDVDEDDWYYGALLWAYENGITVGTSETTFSPEITVTRAQIVTFLYRDDGSPLVLCANPFTDVVEGDWYYEGALWGVDNDIITEIVSTVFLPDNECVRGEMVTILYHYYGE